ncbi:MAG TPA: hypothetical protein V6D47_19790 [Oscillatoriaceae cyanobacterium]
MDALLVIGLYILCTIPFLVLLVMMHALRSDYAKLFIAGIVLQIVPLGLIFFPVGFFGVGLLCYTGISSGRRLRRFRASGLYNPDVLKRWSWEFIANVIAIGFSFEQKGVAWLFTEVTNRHGFGFLWNDLVPVSLAMWAVLAVLIVREHSLRRLFV